MSRCYDRAGLPITLDEWARSFEDNRVAETTLPHGRLVSTVWLGLDHQYGQGPPLIFESMVFPSKGDGGELACERYSTLAEAEAGHARLVAEWSATP